MATSQEIMKMFLQDMQQPYIQMALYTSFRRYTQRVEELVAKYSEKTGIDPEAFHDALSEKMAEEMGLR